MAIDWDSELNAPVMGVFGELAVYMPRGGAPISITDAVFDEEAADIQIGEDGQASTQRKPILGVRAAWFIAQPAQSDRVTIVRTGTAYIVRDVEPDGHGWIKLELMLAKP